MLDPHMERRHHEERWKRVRAEVVAERLRDAADASRDAADGLFQQVNRAVSWKPEQGRSRLLLGALTIALGAALAVLTLYVDMPGIWGQIIQAVVPVMVGCLIGLIARGYLARQRREESILRRQRGAR